MLKRILVLHRKTFGCFVYVALFFAISSLKEEEKATRIITKQTIQIAGSAFATFKVHYWNNYSR